MDSIAAYSTIKAIKCNVYIEITKRRLAGKKSATMHQLQRLTSAVMEMKVHIGGRAEEAQVPPAKGAI